MSWFWNKGPSQGQLGASQGQPIAQQQRNKQIDSLKKVISGVKEEVKDITYSVAFTAGTYDYKLLITLPPGFPKDPPNIYISTPCTHPWISPNLEVVGSPALKNYNLHEDMGKIVKQILEEFQSHPPQRISFERPPTYPQPPPTGAGVPVRKAPLPPTTGVPMHSYKPPPIPEEFPALNKLSDDQLKEYDSNVKGAVLISQFLSEHPVMVKVKQDKEEVLQEIEDQAEINLKHRPELQKGWEELQAKHIELQAVKTKFDKLHQKQMSFLERYTTRSAANTMNQNVLSSETKSDLLGEEFLDKGISVGDFLKKFKEERKLYYLRQEKLRVLEQATTPPAPPSPWGV